MKKNLILAMAMLMIQLAFGNHPNPGEKSPMTTTQIEFFSGNYEEALSLAKSKNLPVFIDISASWCPVCKRMKKEVYTDSKVAEYYNTHFVNLTIDAESEQGKQIMERYELKGFPSYVYLKSDATLNFKAKGFQNMANFLENGKNGSEK